MKKNHCLYWTLILGTSFFMASCAQPRITTIPQSHLPPENIPQIGSTDPGAAPAQRPVRLAVLESMIKKANTQLNRHQPEAAFSTLERALSIDGQDPVIWHLMARARFAQGRYDQAVSLAKKSNTLAVYQQSLKGKNLQIIAEAREQMGQAAD